MDRFVKRYMVPKLRPLIGLLIKIFRLSSLPDTMHGFYDNGLII